MNKNLGGSQLFFSLRCPPPWIPFSWQPILDIPHQLLEKQISWNFPYNAISRWKAGREKGIKPARRGRQIAALRVPLHIKIPTKGEKNASLPTLSRKFVCRGESKRAEAIKRWGQCFGKRQHENMWLFTTLLSQVVPWNTDLSSVRVWNYVRIRICQPWWKRPDFPHPPHFSDHSPKAWLVCSLFNDLLLQCCFLFVQHVDRLEVWKTALSSL